MKLVGKGSNLAWRLRPSILVISTMLAAGGLSQAANAQDSRKRPPKRMAKKARSS